MTTPSASQNQDRVDRLVLVLTGLLVLTVVGMLANNAALIMLPIPLIIGVLTVFGSLRQANEWPARRVIVALAIYHAVSLVIWLVAWLAIGNETVTIAGLPLSMGVLVVIGWPFYSVASGLLYAYCVGGSELANLAADTAGDT